MDFQLKRFISLLLFLFPIILFGCDGSSGSNSSLTNFYLDENNVTIRCENADVNDSDTVNGIIYTKISARTDWLCMVVALMQHKRAPLELPI